jgi:hypothetical protein
MRTYVSIRVFRGVRIGWSFRRHSGHIATLTIAALFVLFVAIRIMLGGG